MGAVRFVETVLHHFRVESLKKIAQLAGRLGCR
jgi:hypothetical protein